MKSSTIIIIIVALLLVGGVFYFMNNKEKPTDQNQIENNEGNTPEIVSVNYMCEGGSSIVANYNNTDDNVALVLSDGREMTLPLAVSASGARFANEDESVVFWNKGNGAFLEEGGVTTFEDCVAEGTEVEEVEPEAEATSAEGVEPALEAEEETPAEEVAE